MKRLVVALAALAACGPALSLDVPQGSPRDSRIQNVNYHDGDVVVVNSTVGAGTRIVFAPNETIIDMASGFPGGWSFTPSRHMLYLMPKSIGGTQDVPATLPKPGEWNTNLMVTTNLRLYDFDLRLIATDRATVDDRVSYRVQFNYPVENDWQAVAEIEREKATQALEAARAIENAEYTMQVGDGAQSITPGMAYDDGVHTYLQFPPNGEIPSAFVINTDGTESIANTHVEGDTLVIHRVATQFVLRLGKAVVGVYNEAFDVNSGSRARGTTVPGVSRTNRGIGQ